MMGVNKVILIGNLGKDPDVVTLPNNDYREDGTSNIVKKATFSLATTEYHKTRDGERKEQTEWHNVVCWRALADNAEKVLRKGSQVYVEGKLQSRTWDDKEGNRRHITEIVADNFVLLTRSRNENNNTNNNLETVLNNDTEVMGDLPF